MEVQKQDIFPFEIKDVEPEVNSELLKLFTGEFTGFVRVGPKGYIVRQKYKQEAGYIYNMPLRPTDVFISGYPRSGTTWTQELVWMIVNDLDYATSDTVPLLRRYTSLDYSIYVHPKMKDTFRDEIIDSEINLEFLDFITKPGFEKLAEISSPRFIKTHMPLSLLPPTLLDTGKMVYVARDPRDVAVSYYHLSKLWRPHGYVGDFKTFWNYFINDLIIWSPFFENVKEAWDQRNKPNMLFLFYEELSKDLASVVRRVATFFDKRFTEEQITRLYDHLNFNNFKNNTLVNFSAMKEISFVTSNEAPFIRKGKVGGWRDYFDEAMARQAERWMADNLRDTDLRFPHSEKS